MTGPPSHTLKRWDRAAEVMGVSNFSPKKLCLHTGKIRVEITRFHQNGIEIFSCDHIGIQHFSHNIPSICTARHKRPGLFFSCRESAFPLTPAETPPYKNIKREPETGQFTKSPICFSEGRRNPHLTVWYLRRGGCGLPLYSGRSRPAGPPSFSHLPSTPHGC